MLRAASRAAQRAWSSSSRPVTIAAACHGGRAFASNSEVATQPSSSVASAVFACAAACGASARASAPLTPHACDSDPARVLTAAKVLMPDAWAAAQQHTFIMIKPDGVHRALVGRIIERFEARGYKLVGIKVIVPSKELAQQHYAEHDGKPFFPKLVDFLSSGAVVAMVWEGNGVVATGRMMIGKTNPLASDSGTIRGDFAVDMGRNIIHGSDSVDSAQKEIALWFKPSELAEYQRATEQWLYEK